MSEFQLYKNLLKDTNNKDLTKEQKQEFIKNVKIIDKNGSDLIYALVIFYNKYNKKIVDEEVNNLPYKGSLELTEVETNKNVIWNFNNFPNTLKQILYKFIVMNSEKIKQDKNRDNK